MAIRSKRLRWLVHRYFSAYNSMLWSSRVLEIRGCWKKSTATSPSPDIQFLFWPWITLPLSPSDLSNGSNRIAHTRPEGPDLFRKWRCRCCQQNLPFCLENMQPAGCAACSIKHGSRHQALKPKWTDVHHQTVEWMEAVPTALFAKAQGPKWSLWHAETTMTRRPISQRMRHQYSNIVRSNLMDFIHNCQLGLEQQKQKANHKDKQYQKKKDLTKQRFQMIPDDSSTNLFPDGRPLHPPFLTERRHAHGGGKEQEFQGIHWGSTCCAVLWLLFWAKTSERNNTVWHFLNGWFDTSQMFFRFSGDL